MTLPFFPYITLPALDRNERMKENSDASHRTTSSSSATKKRSRERASPSSLQRKSLIPFEGGSSVDSCLSAKVV